MIPMQILTLKEDIRYYGKHTKTDALLDDL